MTEGVALALVALSGFVLCAVVVPAYFVRRSSGRDPAGRAHRLASGALRPGWRFVLATFLLSIVLAAVANPLGHQSIR